MRAGSMDVSLPPEGPQTSDYILLAIAVLVFIALLIQRY